MTKPTKRARPIAEAARRSKSPTPTSEVGYCLREVRECLEVGPAAADAIGAWNAAKIRHRFTHVEEIPAGVPIFWAGGSAGHGHIAIAAAKRGWCWSTDIRRPGYFDRVPIDEVTTKWRMTFLGWTEDLNGVRVYPNLVEHVKGG